MKYEILSFALFITDSANDEAASKGIAGNRKNNYLNKYICEEICKIELKRLNFG